MESETWGSIKKGLKEKTNWFDDETLKSSLFCHENAQSKHFHTN